MLPVCSLSETKRNISHFDNNNFCRLIASDQLHDDDDEDTVTFLVNSAREIDRCVLSAAALLKKPRIRRSLREPWTLKELRDLYPPEWFDILLGVSYETFCKLVEILKVII